MANVARREPIAEPQNEPAVVVFGREGKKTPRGAWFTASDHAVVEVGAAEMGLNALTVTDAEVRALALRVPKGRVFASGKLFTPMIQASVHEKLVALLPRDEVGPKLQVVASAAQDKSGEAPASAGNAEVESSLPKDWSDIRVGSLVLARDEDNEAWYEAHVVEHSPKDTMRLKWRDYPEEPTFVRHISRLALLYPSTVKR